MKTAVSLLGALTFAIATPLAAAPPDKGGKGGQHAGQATNAKEGGGGPKKPKHAHKNSNAKNLLGAKLKQDGKHALGKIKDRDVMAEVRGGKVRNMTAGDLPVKRVRTKTKMAAADVGFVRASWNEQFRLAQYDPYYYGYCFDDGYDFYCYWYPEEDVYWQDYTWDDYDPYY